MKGFQGSFKYVVNLQSACTSTDLSGTLNGLLYHLVSGCQSQVLKLLWQKGKLSGKDTRLTFNLLPALLSVAGVLSSERENRSILGSIKKGTRS